MKILIALISTLIFSLILGFDWQSENWVLNSTNELAQSEEVIPLAIVQEMINRVDQDRILTDLRRLTGKEQICTTNNGCTKISGRYTQSDGLRWAKEYVYETLVDLHYSVEIQDWSLGGFSDQNIIARKPGMIFPESEIYFIAHLDGSPENNPAADDDASGIASLLELARVLSKYTLNHTVVLFFSTGEDIGTLGAQSFVNNYPERLSRIEYLISVDMIGYDSNNDGKMELWNGSQSPSFVELLSAILDAYPINLIPEIVSGCT